MAGAAHVTTLSYRNNRLIPNAIEPRAANASWSKADDSYTLARDLLEKAGIAATPGLDFGSNAPEKHIRFAYTTGVPRLAEAVERLGRYFGR